MYEANLHRGAIWGGPYKNGIRKDGSQKVLYQLRFNGQHAQDLMEEMLAALPAAKHWVLQVGRAPPIFVRNLQGWGQCVHLEAHPLA